MTTVPLRYLAELNPSVPEFDAFASDETVGFLPLEAVWSDSRADHERVATKADVASGYTRYRAGDVVVPKVTPTFQAARSMIATRAGAGTTELHVLRPRAGVDPRWVCYAVRSKSFLCEGVAAFQGVAGLQRVPPEFVNAFRVVEKSPDEQRRIADFLDDRVTRIDRIITARRKQIDLLEESTASLVDIILPAVDPSWVRLGPFVRSIEQGWSPQCEAVPAQTDEWGVLKVGAVQRGFFDETENKRLPEAEQPKLEYEVRAGDLLVTRANTPERVGFFTIVPDDVRERLILCDKIMRIEVDAQLNPRFVALVGQSRVTRDRFTLAGTGTSGSMVNIRGDDIRGMGLPLLPQAEQEQLVAVWGVRTVELHKQRTQLVNSIELLTEYKSSLITAAVTGELDVTTAGSNIPG